MCEIKEKYELELTKILAKTMQSSYKKKEIHEILLRIIPKIDSIITVSNDTEEFEILKKEFEILRREAFKLIEK